MNEIDSVTIPAELIARKWTRVFAHPIHPSPNSSCFKPAAKAAAAATGIDLTTRPSGSCGRRDSC